jgi:hypothetical protein
MTETPAAEPVVSVTENAAAENPLRLERNRSTRESQTMPSRVMRDSFFLHVTRDT